jgi:hypothetical protein
MECECLDHDSITGSGVVSRCDLVSLGALTRVGINFKAAQINGRTSGRIPHRGAGQPMTDEEILTDQQNRNFPWQSGGSWPHVEDPFKTIVSACKVSSATARNKLTGKGAPQIVVCWENLCIVGGDPGGDILHHAGRIMPSMVQLA